jgi:NADPH-dependent 2,4-dienoyl-CoA reductase/sulfur reductase-like enzyme
VNETKRNNKCPSRRTFIETTALGAAALAGFSKAQTQKPGEHEIWDKEADVVIVGAGATGLPAAIEAAERGAVVVLVEANWDVGGHAILSGGHLALGGGTSLQRKYGIAIHRKFFFRT